MTDSALPPVARHLRRVDRERFATALFAPPQRREALMALYAFNAELAMVREQVRQPLAGAIRLQWWREAVLGERPDGEVAAHPLVGSLRAAGLPGEVLAGLVEARHRDLEPQPFAGVEDLEAHAAATAGRLAEAAMRLLGGGDLEAARAVGTAYGLVGLLRSLPAEVLGVAGSPQGARQAAGRAATLLDRALARWPGRAGLAALLPGTLAGLHLRRLEAAGWDVTAPGVRRVAVMPLRLVVNALRGRF